MFRHRMKGYPVVWIPGFDHAGIATQMMVEKYISKTKNVTKYDMGREEFLSFIWEWKDEKENTIKSQLKALGASLDWSREYFTMSEVFGIIVLRKIYFNIVICNHYFYNYNSRVITTL